MSFNFSELQQKADRILHNSDEFVRKWIDFLASPAGTVSLQYYDQNGNLQTVSFSNRNKLVQDFIGNVNSAMSKTFYVDSVNGDDANDGSSSAPFKTIKKAIDSVPIGGHGYIFLKNDIVISDTGKIFLEDGNKVIIINGYNTETTDNRRTIKFKIAPLNGSNTVYGFTNLGGCIFGLRYVNIEFIDESDANLPFSAFAQAFDYGSDVGGGFSIYFYASKISIPDIAAVNLVHANSSKLGTVMFQEYSTEINTAGFNSYPFRITDSTFLYNVYDLSLTGVKTSHSDLFVGIVRDTNGVPRNVVSNIVL